MSLTLSFLSSSVSSGLTPIFEKVFSIIYFGITSYNAAVATLSEY